MPATIEDFDDDTDLPLPSPPAPNVPQGDPNPMANFQAMMQALASQDQSVLQKQTEAPGVQYVDDTTPFKEWHPIYPIYLDAKRAYGNKGGRRIPRELAIWWPVTKDIAAALKALHLPVFHEQVKTHPKDWANPGRVKTEFKKDGKFLHPRIQTRKQLYVEVARQMARLPSSVPSSASAITNPSSEKPSGVKPAPSTGQNKPRRHPTRVARPPRPLPAAHLRVSEFSPTIPGGHFLEILKRDKVEGDKRKADAEKAALAGGPSRIADSAAVGTPEKKEKKQKVKIVRGGKR